VVINSCRILGIDPGSQTTGYGLIDVLGSQLGFVACGTIRTNKNYSFSERLLQIHEGLQQVITLHSPEIAAVEDLFVSKNARSALKLGQARGVAVLTAMQARIEVYDYSPRAIKQTVAGYGHAAKAQVQQMVKVLLSLSAVPSSDASDALAVAICHAQHGMNSAR
jgi:crossover junction endodeoxyribonuclease RuvC